MHCVMSTIVWASNHTFLFIFEPCTDLQTCLFTIIIVMGFILQNSRVAPLADGGFTRRCHTSGGDVRPCHSAGGYGKPCHTAGGDARRCHSAGSYDSLADQLLTTVVWVRSIVAHLVFVVDIVALGRVFPENFRCTQSAVIPSVLHIHLSVAWWTVDPLKATE